MVYFIWFIKIFLKIVMENIYLNWFYTRDDVQSCPTLESEKVEFNQMEHGDKSIHQLTIQLHFSTKFF